MAKALKTKENFSPILPVPKTELDVKLEQALKAIDKKLKSLGADSTGTLKYPDTVGFKYNENDGNTINISTNGDVYYLTKALAKMKRLKAEIERSNEEEGFSVVPHWQGQPVDKWIVNLQQRCKQVINGKLIADLNVQRTELSGLMSAEQKLFKALEKAAEIIKS